MVAPIALAKQGLLRFVILTISTLTAASHGAAANVGFMPGDATFRAWVKVTPGSAPADSEMPWELRYGVNLNEASFGGYVGYQRAMIVGGGPLKSKADAIASRLIPKEQGEVAGYHIYLLNRNYDIAGNRIGLRYNEGWHEARVFTRIMGKGRRQPVPMPYSSFVEGRAAVVQDWRRSAAVDPLQADLPSEAGWETFGPRFTEPIQIKAKDILVYLLLGGDDQLHFDQPRKAPYAIVSLDAVVLSDAAKELADDDAESATAESNE